MKKILMLGGSAQQVVAIKKAKELGYYTVLCDFLEDNPGQYAADKFYLESTTDKEAVLNIAIKENVNGVVAYASDPAAPIASYVAEKLNLPTNPYKSVEILANKHLFRKYLSENQFNVPNSFCFNKLDNFVVEKVRNFVFPIMVKPVDSSGSKGISKIFEISELATAVKHALRFSRNKIIQIEEFIKMDHEYLVGGDIFVVEGRVVFWGLLNCHRDNNVNSLVPVGKSYPLNINEKRKLIIKEQIQKLIDSLNIRFGAINVELLFDSSDNLYFIEMGPRNGGNMIPDLLSMISGKDMIEATVRCAMGDFSVDMSFENSENIYATHNLHSNKNGIYKGIEFSSQIEKYIVKKSLYNKQGDIVNYFDGANKSLGIIFMKFPDIKTEKDILDNINSHITILLEER